MEENSIENLVDEDPIAFEEEETVFETQQTEQDWPTYNLEPVDEVESHYKTEPTYEAETAYEAESAYEVEPIYEEEPSYVIESGYEPDSDEPDGEGSAEQVEEAIPLELTDPLENTKLLAGALSAAAASLSIASHPSDISVYAGLTAWFSVQASVPERKTVAYQWQVRTSSSGSWSNCTATSFNKATYSFKALMKFSGRQYRCKVTAGTSTVYSSVATLTVMEPSVLPDKVAFTKYLDVNNSDGYVRGVGEETGMTVKLSDLGDDEYYTPSLVIWNDSETQIQTTISFDIDGESYTWRLQTIDPGYNMDFRTYSSQLKDVTGRHEIIWYYNSNKIASFSWTVV